MVTKKVLSVISKMQKAGYECFLVGGAVRDMLLKRDFESGPLDFATNATPEETMKVFPSSKYENKFGTVIAHIYPSYTGLQTEGLTKQFRGVYTRADSSSSGISEDEIVEITTYRSETTYADSRHPDVVTWGNTIYEDLKRRDFTINALATDGKKIIDEYKGQEDLKAGIIRTVGNPTKRFSEDALRMMRAVRFACELHFTIDQVTLDAIQSQSKRLSKVSMERIRDEFMKILKSDMPDEGIKVLRNTELLRVFLPELYDTFGVGQVSPQRHHIYDVGTHLLNTLAACKNSDPIVRLACLLHDIGKPKVRQILDSGVVTFYNHEIVGTDMVFDIANRLRLSKKDTILLTKLVRYHQFVVTENLTDNAVRRFIRQIGVENIQNMLDLRFADRIGSGAKADSWRFDLFRKRLEEVQHEPFAVKDLAIDGNDVMKFYDKKPGPFIGEVLDKVFAEVTEHGLENKKEVLLEYLKKSKIQSASWRTNVK